MDGAGLYKQHQIKKNSPPDISAVIATLDYFHPLSEGITEYFRKHSYACSFRKGKLLLKAGQVCEHIYFIKKGAVRGFIKEGKKDITTWITAENEVVSSISALDMKIPAMENMQAIENCELLALTYDNFQELYVKFPEFNIVARKVLQKYYQDAEGRAFIVRLTNAENKYQLFITRYGHLANRIPLKYIASFLGITLETLSRVRKKLSLKK
ncbi:MAG TPA: Crp/Fnr family transcriptional regulator [Chitinophagaceae bacterium]|jgi:CRP-like cAMP-binding protein|nr:Crp/Fnr family transcriptional regulator [Chitinophagaceae bacterium]